MRGQQKDEKQKCEKCEDEFTYSEQEDQKNNQLVPYKLRKIVVDDKGIMIPLYSLPKDKQRLINKQFIKMLCNKCSLNKNTE